MMSTGTGCGFSEAIAGFTSSTHRLGVSVFVFLTLLLLPEQARTYFEILKSLGIFAAGAAGGYGLRTYQERRQG